MSTCQPDLHSNVCSPHISGHSHHFNGKELRGVVCSAFACCFQDYLQPHSGPLIESSAALDLLRPGLAPCLYFEDQVTKLMAKLPSVSKDADSFVPVHVRVEADFEAACKGRVWADNAWDHVCWANDVDICNFLLSRLPVAGRL